MQARGANRMSRASHSANGLPTLYHETFHHATVNHGHLITGHLITLKFNHGDTLSRSQVSQKKVIMQKHQKHIIYVARDNNI